MTMKILQLNLNYCEIAQDLLQQIVRDVGVDIAIECEEIWETLFGKSEKNSFTLLQEVSYILKLEKMKVAQIEQLNFSNKLLGP